MMATSISQDEIQVRTTALQDIVLNVHAATSDRVRTLVTNYASSIGCPKEFFLLPLQSRCAHSGVDGAGDSVECRYGPQRSKEVTSVGLFQSWAHKARGRSTKRSELWRSSSNLRGAFLLGGASLHYETKQRTNHRIVWWTEFVLRAVWSLQVG